MVAGMQRVAGGHGWSPCWSCRTSRVCSSCSRTCHRGHDRHVPVGFAVVSQGSTSSVPASVFLVSGAAVHLAGFSHGLPFVSVGARSVGQRTCGRGDWLASVLELPACARLDLFFFIERVTTVDMDQHVPVWFGSGVCGGACRGHIGRRVRGPRSGTAPFCNLWWG